jgi:hypothetical protein
MRIVHKMNAIALQMVKTNETALQMVATEACTPR